MANGVMLGSVYQLTSALPLRTTSCMQRLGELRQEGLEKEQEEEEEEIGDDAVEAEKSGKGRRTLTAAQNRAQKRKDALKVWLRKNFKPGAPAPFLSNLHLRSSHGSDGYRAACSTMLFYRRQQTRLFIAHICEQLRDVCFVGCMH